MTTEELRAKLNKEFGMNKEWPNYYIVDHETYANVCNTIFSRMISLFNENYFTDEGLKFNLISISVGVHGGIFFKGVELLLEEPE